MELNRLDHVGIAVADLDAARAFYERVLGLKPAHEEIIQDQGVHEVLYRMGDAWVQLVTPLGPDTPVGRFLEKRGEGLHHVGYSVTNVSTSLSELRTAGVETVDEAPRIGSGGTTVAFAHPKSAHGVLIELVEEGSGHRGA
ncbi:MAG TPA: methylmalonyl-CoA epimerase [Actinomycetes bacterium]|nr:methylmalonyl-CoA epimerase [Actinomycetes bacterium]